MRFIVFIVGCAFSMFVCAHDFKVGDLRIVHPFATPSPTGAKTGAVYLAELENQGEKPDRLISATSPVAENMLIHSMHVDANGVMRMREKHDLPLPPKSLVKMRPGQGTHLMLVNVKQPLKDGDTFPVVLEFEQAGKLEVKVYVQTPRKRQTDTEHKH